MNGWDALISVELGRAVCQQPWAFATSAPHEQSVNKAAIPTSDPCLPPPVAIIRRFDRTPNQSRIPYMSGATLLQSSRNEEHAYTEIVDAMRSRCVVFSASAQQLWRRPVFNFLITNVDDHLQNIGFLYVDKNQWQLSPSFDLNPFPDKDRESKTWLSEETGPITSVAQLLGQAARFQLKPHEATAVLAEVVNSPAVPKERLRASRSKVSHFA